MNILLICDDYWHPAEVVMRGLSFLKDAGHDVDIVMDAKDIVTEALLQKYDLVIIAKGNALVGANQHAWFEEGVTLLSPAGYQKYVEDGGSVLIFHAGASFTKDDCPEMTAFTGVSFIEHPKQCPVTIQVTQKCHPIADGITDYALKQDEHYFIERLENEGEVVLESVSHAGRQPACIAREIGKGRLCVLTPGHNMYVYQNEMFQKTVLNAVEWTAKKR